MTHLYFNYTTTTIKVTTISLIMAVDFKLKEAIG